MKAFALDRTPSPARPARAPAPPAALLAQRHSTLGGGSIAAPPLVGEGRPLEPAARQQMEQGFGRDFGAIRVHDDARAHDGARSLGALAYAAGDNIVFGEGQYRPQTAVGQALIAHELAHSVQQSGVQMKAEGPLPAAADARLEAEADAAASAVTGGRSVSALSRIGAPAVFRATTVPTGGGAPPPNINTSPKNVPAWVTATVDDDLADSAPSQLIVCKDKFDMPLEKGAGPWVKDAYGKVECVSTVYTKDRLSSFKEDSTTPQYQGIWLGQYGFTTLLGLTSAILGQKGKNANVTAHLADKNFTTYIMNLGGGLRKASSAIDHIVEKHMGGASVPANLQLHDGKRNTDSGRESWNGVRALITDCMAPGMRGASAQKIQIRFKSVTVPHPGPEDPTYKVEKLLRDGDVKGSDVVKAAAQGKPVTLTAGANTALADIKDKDETPIPESAGRVVSGAILTKYVRAKPGAKDKNDYVHGDLDNRALKKTGAATSAIKFTATLVPAAAATPAPAAPGDATAAVAPAPVATETRKLTVAPGTKQVPFEYLYLSPGYLDTPTMDEKGKLSGKGIIDSNVKFLGKLNVDYGPDKFDLVKNIDHEQINNSKFMKPLASIFRVTKADVSIDLLRFKPKGEVAFTLGPATKPIMLGTVSAEVDGGVFSAKGKLTPGVAIPGVASASGEVNYHAEKGWSGSIQAKSTSVPLTTIDCTLGFSEEAGEFVPKAEGGLTTTVKNKTFGLTAKWTKKSGLVFTGSFTWLKPFPIVDSIAAWGSFSDGAFFVGGKGKFNFRNTWKGDITVEYRKKEDGTETFSGDGSVEVETKNKKGKGSLTAHIDEKGRLSGTGKISYQITPKVKPELTVTLDKQNRLTIAGSVTLGPYTIFERYPKKGEGLKDLFKITSPPWSIPTPIPGVRAYVKLYAGVSYQIYFGPGVVKTIVIAGSFDPLEEDPAIVASVDADFECEAGAVLSGKFGATLGVDVLLGAGAVEGSINVGPYIKANVLAKAKASGKYEAGDFSLSLKPEFSLNLLAGFTVDGSVQISALWGLLSHTWTFPIAAAERPLASKTIAFDELKLTLGGGKGLPGAQDKATLPNLDPIDIVKGLLDKPKDATAPNPNYDPNAREPIERGFKV